MDLWKTPDGAVKSPALNHSRIFFRAASHAALAMVAIVVAQVAGDSPARRQLGLAHTR